MFLIFQWEFFRLFFYTGGPSHGDRGTPGTWNITSVIRSDIKATWYNGMGMIIECLYFGALYAQTQCTIYCCVLLSKKKYEELVLLENFFATCFF